MIKKIDLILLFPFLIASIYLSNTQAATITSSPEGLSIVTNCTEAGLKSALASNKIITFNCGLNPVTIPLTSEIMISDDRIIYGDEKITLDGQGITRIFRVVPYRGLMLDHITLKNGKATKTANDPIGQGQGAAIFVDVWSDITVQNVVFQNNKSETNVACAGGGAIRLNGFNYAEVFNSTFIGNTAPNGGAISNLTADLVVRDSRFDSNQATFDGLTIPSGSNCNGGGGAIFIDGASPPTQGGNASIQITNSIFSNNMTKQSGGAIFGYLYSNDILSIDHSTFDTNQAFFTQRADGTVPSGLGMGGALYLGWEQNDPARLFKGKYVVTNSTLNGNHADMLGGAIEVGNANLELTNDTLANNEATNSKGNLPSDPLYRGAGGGLWINIDKSVAINNLLRNVTIAYNNAGYIGGGIAGYSSQSNMATRMQNSVVSNNTAAGSNKNCQVTLIDLLGNVQYPGPTGGSVNCSSSILTSPLNLGSLGNYGGLTKTVPLQSGSAAIDHGVAGCPSSDQRGYARNGTSCDSGAFEYNGLPLNKKAYLPTIRK